MKNFDDFRVFMAHDCMLDQLELGKSILKSLTQEQIDAIGLTPEALVALSSFIVTSSMKYVALTLQRYHEWNHSFPDRAEDDGPKYP